MRKGYLTLLLMLSACQPDLDVQAPQTQSPDVPGDDYATGEIYLSFSGTGSDGSSGEPVDACYFTGPDETVVLVEFLAPTQIVEVGGTCDDPDPYRLNYGLVSAKVLRTAFGTKLTTVDAISYNDRVTAGGHENRLDRATAGRTELWSMRKGGDEWFVMTRWPVGLSSDPSDVQSSAELALPTNWTDLAAVLREARDNHETLCTDPGDAHRSNNRRMTDAEFDTWAHTPEDISRLCDGVSFGGDIGNDD